MSLGGRWGRARVQSGGHARRKARAQGRRARAMLLAGMLISAGGAGAPEGEAQESRAPGTSSAREPAARGPQVRMDEVVVTPSRDGRPEEEVPRTVSRVGGAAPGEER